MSYKDILNAKTSNPIINAAVLDVVAELQETEWSDRVCRSLINLNDLLLANHAELSGLGSGEILDLLNLLSIIRRYVWTIGGAAAPVEG